MRDGTSVRLRTIRIAGLSRVKRAALRMGVTTVERDMKILRDVANGNVPEAAFRSGCSQATVTRVVKRYEEIALALLQRSRSKQNIPGRIGEDQEVTT